MKKGMEIEFVKAGELKWLEPVLEGDPFDPFRKYRMVGGKNRVAYRAARLAKAGEADPKEHFMLAVSEEERPLAFAALKRHELASEAFGLNMGHVEISFVKGAESHLEALLEAVLSEGRERGFEHLALNVDTSNAPLFRAAHQKDFFLTSAQLMFLYFYRPHRLPKAIERFGVRKYRADDYENVLEIARGSFQHHMRFSRDPYLDSDHIPQFYLQWLNRLIQESDNRFGYVSSLAHKATGFSFARFDPLFEKMTGVRKVGEGLSGVSEKGKGSYPALWSRALKDLRNDVDIFEAQCLIENTEVIRTLSAFDFQLVRSQYVMHLYLGEKQ